MTTTIRRVLFACTVLSIALALGLAVAPSPARAGIHYKADTVVSGAHDSSTKVEAWIEGGKGKILFVDSDQPMLEANEYLLTTDGGKTLYLVNPKEKTYTQWDLQAMLQTFGDVMESMKGVVNLDFSDPKVEKLEEGPGGQILGHATTHTRFRTSYTTSIKIMGMKRSSSTETVQDLWTTDAFNDAALGVWLRTEPPATGIEGLDKLIKSSMDQVKGLPLKSVVVSTTTGQKGKRETTSRTETEVTLLEETSVPGSTFEIPEGYKEQQMEMDGQDGQKDEGNPFSRFLKGKGKSGGGR